MAGHSHLGRLNVPGGGVEDVAVDQQRPHRLAGRVPVRHLDGLVHVDVGEKVRAASPLTVLVEPVRPTWFGLKVISWYVSKFLIKFIK